MRNEKIKIVPVPLTKIDWSVIREISAIYQFLSDTAPMNILKYDFNTETWNMVSDRVRSVESGYCVGVFYAKS